MFEALLLSLKRLKAPPSFCCCVLLLPKYDRIFFDTRVPRAVASVVIGNTRVRIVRFFVVVPAFLGVQEILPRIYSLSLLLRVVFLGEYSIISSVLFRGGRKED